MGVFVAGGQLTMAEQNHHAKHAYHGYNHQPIVDTRIFTDLEMRPESCADDYKSQRAEEVASDQQSRAAGMWVDIVRFRPPSDVDIRQEHPAARGASPVAAVRRMAWAAATDPKVFFAVLSKHPNTKGTRRPCNGS